MTSYALRPKSKSMKTILSLFKFLPFLMVLLTMRPGVAAAGGGAPHHGSDAETIRELLQTNGLVTPVRMNTRLLADSWTNRGGVE